MENRDGVCYNFNIVRILPACSYHVPDVRRKEITRGLSARCAVMGKSSGKSETRKRMAAGIKAAAGTLSFRIIFVIIVLILPLNIYTVYSAGTYQNIIIDQTRTSMENLANLYAGEVEARTKTINTFIAEIEESNADFRDISNAEQWDYYYISAIGLQNVLDEHMTLYRDGDMFFFYSGRMEHGLLVESSADLKKDERADALFNEDAFIKGARWQIISIGDTKWLIHVNLRRGVYIGAGIQLDTCDYLPHPGREYYRVRIDAGLDDDFFETHRAAEVSIWADTGQPFSVIFGNDTRVCFDGLDYSRMKPIVPLQDRRHRTDSSGKLIKK